MLGFWTNLLFYPVIGAHHYEFSPLPWWFQTLAIVFRVGMLVPVWAGSGNFALTLRGRWSTVRRSYALPFIAVGDRLLLRRLDAGHGRGVSLPAGDLAPDELHRRALARDDVRLHHLHRVGRHLRAAAARDGEGAAAAWVGIHFWLALIGVTVYVAVLSIAGTQQGLTWANGDPFIASVEAASPYWLARAVSGTMMFLAHVVFAYNVYA